MNETKKSDWRQAVMLAALGLAASAASADVVTDWNTRANDIVASAKLPPPPAYRVMAIVQMSVYEAVNAITRQFPSDRIAAKVEPDASIDAAVAAANRVALTKLLPTQQSAIDSAYQAAITSLSPGLARDRGIVAGEQAAAATLALRADDGAATPEQYRPHTTPGVYVPTLVPATPQWSQRKPWVLAQANQFRPEPPPSLSSERWGRDYNEIKALGARHGSRRSEKQTDIARFWEATGPAIYFPIVLSVANLPNREITTNARLLAAAGVAMDDALTAVMDAKYHYHFWRPITAIRNGDKDGNDATERDAAWLPLIDTPMHPEYPCAHCILAGAVGEVVRAEIGNGRTPTLRTTSVTAKGAERHWTRIDDFMQEVANARIYDGVHFRTSTDVGTAMGRKVGQLVANRLLRQQVAQSGQQQAKP